MQRLTPPTLLLAVTVGIPVGLAAREVARPGEWIIYSDPANRQHSTLALPANELSAFLLIRCSAGQPSVSIMWSRPPGSPDTSIETWLDGRPAGVTSWPSASNLKESLYPGDSADFLRHLRAASTLIVRGAPDPLVHLPNSITLAEVLAANQTPVKTAPPLLPQAQESITATFTLSSLSAMLDDLSESCGR